MRRVNKLCSGHHRAVFFDHLKLHERNTGQGSAKDQASVISTKQVQLISQCSECIPIILHRVPCWTQPQRVNFACSLG